MITIRFYIMLAASILFGLFSLAIPVFAEDEVTYSDDALAIEAVAGKDRNVRVGETVVFDGTGSFNPIDNELQYEWDFGNGVTEDGSEATHIYWKPGEYDVTLRVNNGVLSVEDRIVVTVEQDIVVMITDDTISKEQITEVVRRGKEKGVLFVPVTIPRGDSTYLVGEELVDRLLLVQDDLQKSSIIVTWTRAGLGMQSLLGLEQRLTEGIGSGEELSSLGFSSKVVVDISSMPYWLLQRVGESVLDIVEVQSVLLARESVIDNIIANPAADDFVANYVTLKGDDFRHIVTATSLNSWGYSNSLFRIHNALLRRGTPLRSLLLILFVPVVAAIIAFARAFFGVRAFGIFVPTVVALSFIMTGIRHGLPVFLAILLLASLVRFGLKQLRFLYLARITLVLIVVSVSLIGMLVLGAIFERFGFLAVPIFPLLVMVVLVEQFLAVQIDKGIGASLRITFETVLLGVMGYYLANWEVFRVFVFSYPLFVLLIVLVATLFLGRFVGLRLGEYFRFKQVIDHVHIPKKK